MRRNVVDGLLGGVIDPPITLPTDLDERFIVSFNVLFRDVGDWLARPVSRPFLSSTAATFTV